MIREIDQRAWVVSAAPPAKAQYYSGQVDGSSTFHCNPRSGIPLTHTEAKRVKFELEQLFSKRHEKYEIIWLGDVA